MKTETTEAPLVCVRIPGSHRKRACMKLQTFKAHIDATHPMNEDAPVGALEADALAMQLSATSWT